jgi:hypothetical protein
MAIRAVDAFLVYQTVKRLTTPFKNWDAYKAGIIDDKGNVIKKRGTLTPDEQKYWGYFDILTANLKKLLSKLPGGASRLATIAAAAYLLKEHKDNYNKPINEQLLNEFIDRFTEDAPANSVGGGQIAGIGIGDQGEPGVYKRKRSRTILAMVKRKFKQ